MFMPFPNPVISLETINCGKLKDAHWIVAPITMIDVPVKIVLFRPSQLPSQMVATAPKKHPKV